MYIMTLSYQYIHKQLTFLIVVLDTPTRASSLFVTIHSLIISFHEGLPLAAALDAAAFLVAGLALVVVVFPVIEVLAFLVVAVLFALDAPTAGAVAFLALAVLALLLDSASEERATSAADDVDIGLISSRGAGDEESEAVTGDDMSVSRDIIELECFPAVLFISARDI
jgi:membrane protein implicated in regulation of membrane protease activity